MIIYKTRNKINGKIYVGKDARNRPSYIGSGTLLRRAVKKYGKENFEKITIEKCSSLTHLAEREVYWVRELNTTDKNVGYNITLGGTGGDTTTNMPSEDRIRMLENRSVSLKKAFASPEFRRWRTTTTKNMWTTEHTEMMRNKMSGRKITWDTGLSKNRSSGIVSEEHREKLRSAATGKIFVQVNVEMEEAIVKMYQECGPKRMAKRLGVSAYVIRRVLKKKGVYQKWRKKRPELKA
jgi:group I intron endonuclease